MIRVGPQISTTICQARVIGVQANAGAYISQILDIRSDIPC